MSGNRLTAIYNLFFQLSMLFQNRGTERSLCINVSMHVSLACMQVYRWFSIMLFLIR